MEASEIAGEAMRKGSNCCEAVLIAANTIWDLNLRQDTLAAGSLFKEGMGSGCTCGALVGMVMASGIYQARLGLSKNEKFAAKLHKRFKQEFKSSCCAVLCKNHSLSERFGNKGCIRMTSRAATLLVEEWENDLGHHSYL
jgi:C_GCAxxG_C_C family probable redox protein